MIQQLLVELTNLPWKTPEEYTDLESKILKMIHSREYLTTDSKEYPLILLNKNTGDRKNRPIGVTFIRITGLHDCLLAQDLQYAEHFGKDITDVTKAFFPHERVA